MNFPWVRAKVFNVSFTLCLDRTAPSDMLRTEKVHGRALVPDTARRILHWPRRWIRRYLGPSGENPRTGPVPEYLHHHDHLHQTLDLFQYVHSNPSSNVFGEARNAWVFTGKGPPPPGFSSNWPCLLNPMLPFVSPTTLPSFSPSLLLDSGSPKVSLAILDFSAVISQTQVRPRPILNQRWEASAGLGRVRGSGPKALLLFGYFFPGILSRVSLSAF